MPFRCLGVFRVVSLRRLVALSEQHNMNQVLIRLSRECAPWHQSMIEHCIWQMKHGASQTLVITALCVIPYSTQQWLWLAENQQCFNNALAVLVKEHYVHQSVLQWMWQQWAYPLQLLAVLGCLGVYWYALHWLSYLPCLILMLWFVYWFYQCFDFWVHQYTCWRAWHAYLWVMRYVALRQALVLPHIAVLMATLRVKHPKARMWLMEMIEILESGGGIEAMLYRVKCLNKMLISRLLNQTDNHADMGDVLERVQDIFWRRFKRMTLLITCVFYALFCAGFLGVFYVVYQPIMQDLDQML